MSSAIFIGDRVRLLGLPDRLIHDLPQAEQEEMRSFVGGMAVVTEVDAHGYFWLGFGETITEGDFDHYTGHAFCVPREFIERVGA